METIRRLAGATMLLLWVPLAGAFGLADVEQMGVDRPFTDEDMVIARHDRLTTGASARTAAGRSRTGRIPTMRVTEKGQVTIPKELRDELGIGAGSEIAFERVEDAIVIRKVRDGHGRGARVVDQLRGRGDVAMSTDEIMALTRGG